MKINQHPSYRTLRNVLSEIEYEDSPLTAGQEHSQDFLKRPEIYVESFGSLPVVICAPYAVKTEKYAGRVALALAILTDATLVMPLRVITDPSIEQDINNPLIQALSQLIARGNFSLLIEIRTQITGGMAENIIVDRARGKSTLGWPLLLDKLVAALAPVGKVYKSPYPFEHGRYIREDAISTWTRKHIGIPAISLTLSQYVASGYNPSKGRDPSLQGLLMTSFTTSLPEIVNYCTRVKRQREVQKVPSFEVEARLTRKDLEARIEEVKKAGGTKKYAELDWEDMQGIDLSEMKLKKVRLFGSDLSGANLRGTKLIGADLGGVNFSGADLTNAELMEAKLKGANFTDAVIIGADFTRARLTKKQRELLRERGAIGIAAPSQSEAKEEEETTEETETEEITPSEE